MAVVKVEPTKEHSVPYDTSDDVVPTLLEEIAVAGNTAELKAELGSPLEVTPENAAREKELIEAVAQAKKPKNLEKQSTAFAAASFLRS